MPIVKITNPNPYDWRGTKCFIDGNKVPRVRSIDFHVSVDEIPVFEFEIAAVPDIEMECLAQISVTSQSITDAISVFKARTATARRNLQWLQIKPKIGFRIL